MSELPAHVAAMLEECREKIYADTTGEAIEELEQADFENTRKCHDWRNHVAYDVVEVWDSLSLEGRLVAFLQAEQMADREDWD